LLKANTAITRMGRNRNPYTTTAHAVNACLAVSRRLRTELLLFGGDQDVCDDEHRERCHQPDRQGRAERLECGCAENPSYDPLRDRPPRLVETGAFS